MNLNKLQLHWKIIIGMVLGVLFGFLMSNFEIGKTFISDWIKPFGTIFINSLKLIAIPLIFASLVKGISDLKDISKLSKMGGITITTYLITTVIAVSLGLVIVNVIKPGNSISEQTRDELKGSTSYVERLEKKRDKAIDEINIFYSEKVTKAGALNTKDEEQKSKKIDEIKNQFKNKLPEAKKKDEQNQEKLKELNKIAKEREGLGPLQPLIDIFPSNIVSASSDNKNMLQVIFFAMMLAISIILIPQKKSKPVKDFFDSLNEIVLKFIELIMKFAPFAVFALLASVVSEVPEYDLLKSLLMYSLTLIFGLFILIILYSIFVKIFTGKNPSVFFKGILPAQLVAFSTSSSAATLPVTMDRVENNLNVDKEVTSFVLPIGATMNMDGTALYQAVAAIFLAQLIGDNVDLITQLGIILTATLASIGAAAVPSAGIVVLVIVLSQAGIPEAGIALIFAVDRPLDMLRTVVNVTGDATVSLIVDKIVSKK